MDEHSLRHILELVRLGETDVGEALRLVRDLPFADLGFAKVDHHRALRQGQPEVIFGGPKTAEQIAAIALEISRDGANVLVTRVDAEKFDALSRLVPTMQYVPIARVACLVVTETPKRPQRIVIVAAGTADIPVASEAYETLRINGFEPERLVDVGVAGIHRLMACRESLTRADAVIVVAGMEGALPSVVGGLIGCPIVAVPTSVGYGTHLGGFTPLLAMLSSCASGVVVVNIDNGFGAAMAVIRMFSKTSRQQ